MNEWTRDPREILETYAAAMRANMLTYSIWAGNYAHRDGPSSTGEIFAEAGWSKQDVRDLRARAGAGDARRVALGGQGRGGAGARTRTQVYTALRSPDDLLVIAAGGPAGRLRRRAAAVVRPEVAGRHRGIGDSME